MNPPTTNAQDRRCGTESKSETWLPGIADDLHVEHLDGAVRNFVIMAVDQVKQRLACFFVTREPFTVGPRGLNQHLRRTD